MVFNEHDLSEIRGYIAKAGCLRCDDCPVNCESFDTKSQCEVEQKKLMPIFANCKNAKIISKELFIGKDSIGFEVCCENRKW